VIRRVLRLGLTGPIGCGKSTVAGWLGELGAHVVDADAVSHEISSPGSAVVAQIGAEFGAQLIRPDGSLDRPALGRIVFDDSVALARLEAIVHPAVRPRILEAIAAADRAGAPAVVVEAIKLVESGLGELCDEIWLVVCDPEAQRARVTDRFVARAADRGASPEEAETEADRRIAAQADIATRLAPAATRVVDTSGALAATRAAVDAAWSAARAAHG